MNLTDLQQKLKDRVRDAARELFSVTLDQPNAETPPRPELGDLAFPVSFELAKLVKQTSGEKIAPRTIAERLKTALEELPEVSQVEIAGPGYINVFFDRATLLQIFAAKPEALMGQGHQDSTKKMVEHTSINPNKAAHIGHVRNAVLGDTFVRILNAAGERVEVQNYIDNTGVQGCRRRSRFHANRKKTLEQIKALDVSLPPITLSITTVGISIRRLDSSTAMETLPVR
jgi:arginyl-tRNA synthetase